MSSKSVNTRIDKLIKNIAIDFDLQKLSKSSARFNLQKLEWFNREYLKMMNLVEFAYRASDFKLKNSFIHNNLESILLKDSVVSNNLEKNNLKNLNSSENLSEEISSEEIPRNFRTGDYVMLVDLKKQKVFANLGISASGQDGKYYLLGGGRELDEEPLDGLVREVKEESDNKIILEKDKIKKICEFRVYSKESWERDGQTFAGKDFNVYFYPLEITDIKTFNLKEDEGNNNGKGWDFDWYDLDQLLEANHFLTYPIWHNFCQKENLECLEPSQKTILSYLGFSLDKNRITTLGQVGEESNCILDWQKPSMEDLKWKQIDVKESLENLKEIFLAIKKMFYDKHAKLENKLLHLAVKNLLKPEKNTKTSPENTQIYSISETLSREWEAEIKLWLSDNQKKPGNYLWPLRVALSGKKQSPSPFDFLTILPRSEVENRIDQVLEYLD